MLFKKLGRTGIRIPELGIGTHDYHAGPGPLRRGLESGALFIDTAESIDLLQLHHPNPAIPVEDTMAQSPV